MWSHTTWTSTTPCRCAVFTRRTIPVGIGRSPYVNIYWLVGIMAAGVATDGCYATLCSPRLSVNVSGVTSSLLLSHTAYALVSSWQPHLPCAWGCSCGVDLQRAAATCGCAAADKTSFKEINSCSLYFTSAMKSRCGLSHVGQSAYHRHSTQYTCIAGKR